METYPLCPEQGSCDTVWVYVADKPPRIEFDSADWAFRTRAEAGSFAELTLKEAGREGRFVDPMMASGFLVAFLAIWGSLPLDRVFRNMIAQVHRDRILDWSDESYVGIERLRQRLAFAVSGIVGVLMLVGYLLFYKASFNSWTFEFFTGSVLLSMVAGHRLGSSAGYGAFARKLRQSQTEFRLYVGHADKIGGMRRLGEFLAYQCILGLIPVIWLSTWLYIEIRRPDLYPAYSGWILLHAALMVVALATYWPAFLRPFFLITARYRKARADLQDRYRHRLRQPLTKARADYENARTWEDEQAALGALAKISSMQESIEALPSVPMRPAVSGAFSLSALYPFATLITGFLVEKGTGVAEAIDMAISVFKASGL